MKVRYFNKWEVKQIFNLIEINPLEAKIKYEEYLEKYPKDYSSYAYYASVLVMLGLFDEAEKVLDFVENLFKRNSHFLKQSYKVKLLEQCILSSRLRLLSYQEKYDELYDVCLKNFQDIKNMNMTHLFFYCRKKLGILDFDKRDNNSYLFRQIIDYKEDDFLNHIQKHLSDYNVNDDVDKKSVFVSSFPINEVINEVKKYIPSDRRLCFGVFQDVYIFRYNECGRDSNRMVDYFKVICFHGTSEFITICPSMGCENLPYIDLNYLIHDTKNNKLKKISQIEKFNQRYKHN